MDSLNAAFVSFWNYLKLVFADKLHRNKERLGRSYHIGEHGEYRIFRETISYEQLAEKKVVVLVGFRLKLLGKSNFMHKLFQKVCILTTPFWCGFPGFYVKLWMVQPQTGNYLGIYDWAGKANAQTYVEWLIKMLKPLSLPGTVWYKIYETDFETYLEKHEYKLP